MLNFYKAYRALVRAKVSLFSMPSEASPVQRATTLRQYRNYANLAESYSTIPSRFLAITHGVSAVGKSHVSMRLVEALGAVRRRFGRGNANACSASSKWKTRCRPVSMQPTPAQQPTLV